MCWIGQPSTGVMDAGLEQPSAAPSQPASRATFHHSRVADSHDVTSCVLWFFSFLLYFCGVYMYSAANFVNEESRAVQPQHQISNSTPRTRTRTQATWLVGEPRLSPLPNESRHYRHQGNMKAGQTKVPWSPLGMAEVPHKAATSIITLRHTNVFILPTFE